MDAILSAKQIYSDSLDSLMAHTIRATQNYFRRNLLELDVQIRIDRFKTVFGNDSKLFGILETQLIPKMAGSKLARWGRVDAKIFINPDASKQLARFTIAHEIYHLLLELQQWASNTNKDEWKKIAITSEMENQCNGFAQALCYLHDQLNRDPQSREKHIYFNPDFFKEPIIVGPDGTVNIPPGILEDRSESYWKQPKPRLGDFMFPWIK
jgi:Zn-dependent peptidase ImmA (M78 family)